MLEGQEPPHISVAVGVTVGLLASLVQSFGLTVQRLSHVANEKLAVANQKRDWQRPLWLGGFAIFILSNVFGTVFQIGALPIVVLGPLGAVSLLWNAAFAKLVLGDEFTVHLVVGTVLIAGGAVLIGIFGVVPEETHTLPELVRLYRRPAFLVWVSLLAVFLVAILAVAHVSEWRLARAPRSSRRRRKSFPRTTPFASSSSSSSDGPTRDADDAATESTPLLAPRAAAASSSSSDDDAELPRPPSSTTTTRFRLSFAENERDVDANHVYSPAPSIVGRDRRRSDSASGGQGEQEEGGGAGGPCRRIETTRVWVGAAYGATSGTLSGLCLLFTKTGVELLIMSIVGKTNQFGHVEAWLIIVVLLVCELFQLAYLNRALRLVGPTLVCPLAFCFYNTTSIVSGLVYYDQADDLSTVSAVLVAVGIAVLLAGVWVVSIKSTGDGDDDRGAGATRSRSKAEEDDDEEAAAAGPCPTTMTRVLVERHDDAFVDEPEDDDEEDPVVGGGGAANEAEPLEWRPRGFSIGLAASSPGFDLRPHHHHHPGPKRRTDPFAPPTTTTLDTEEQRQRQAWDRDAATTRRDGDDRLVLEPLTATTSRPRRGAGPRTTNSRRSMRGSLSGSLYVGPPSPCPGVSGGHRTSSRIGDSGEAPREDEEEEDPKKRRSSSWWSW